LAGLKQQLPKTKLKCHCLIARDEQRARAGGALDLQKQIEPAKTEHHGPTERGRTTGCWEPVERKKIGFESDKDLATFSGIWN
jgi:hypothetical protein